MVVRRAQGAPRRSRPRAPGPHLGAPAALAVPQPREALGRKGEIKGGNSPAVFVFACLCAAGDGWARCRAWRGLGKVLTLPETCQQTRSVRAGAYAAALEIRRPPLGFWPPPAAGTQLVRSPDSSESLPPGQFGYHTSLAHPFPAQGRVQTHRARSSQISLRGSLKASGAPDPSVLPSTPQHTPNPRMPQGLGPKPSLFVLRVLEPFLTRGALERDLHALRAPPP